MQPELASKETSLENLSLREKVAFYLEDTDSIIGVWSNLSILGLILLSSALFVAQTYPINQSLEASLEIVDLAILI
ncbi:MAG: ion transporter, partial [Waterburya sp.]